MFFSKRRDRGLNKGTQDGLNRQCPECEQHSRLFSHRFDAGAQLPAGSFLWSQVFQDRRRRHLVVVVGSVAALFLGGSYSFMLTLYIMCIVFLVYIHAIALREG